MTTVGHSITGLSIAVLFAPQFPTVTKRIVYYVLFTLCALIPDIDIHGWGHHRYHVSHSLVIMISAVIGISIFSLIIPFIRRNKVYWRFFIGCAIAWLSHFFLDSLYNHGKGVLVMWPLSEGRLNFALPWFSTIPDFPVTMVHVRIVLIEFIFYTPLLLISILLKKAYKRKMSCEG